MNTKIISIALALTLPLTVAAFPGGEGGRSEARQANKVERLAQKLNLTADQKTKMETIFKQRQEKFDAIRTETRARMQDVLSAEQMTQLDQLKKQRKENRQQGKGKGKGKGNKQNRMQ